MSQTILKNGNWDYIKNSQVIPFLDSDMKYLGCQLFMKFNKNKPAMINLIDEKYNNLYSY